MHGLRQNNRGSDRGCRQGKTILRQLRQPKSQKIAVNPVINVGGRQEQASRPGRYGLLRQASFSSGMRGTRQLLRQKIIGRGCRMFYKDMKGAMGNEQLQ